MTSRWRRIFPCCASEAIAALGVRRGGRYLDATFGAGGYTRAILRSRKRACSRSTAIPTAVRAGQRSSTRCADG